MKRALLGAVTAAAALLVVNGAVASPPQATGVAVSAAFSDPQPADALLVCGFPSTPSCGGIPVQIRWGVLGTGETRHSGLAFEPIAAGSALDLGTNFSLGALTHFNFVTALGSSVSDIDLNVSLTATTPDGPLSVALALPIHIDESINEPTAAECPPQYQPVTTIPCPDILHLPPGFQQTVPVAGSTHAYTLRILGFALTATATSPVTDLVTQEELENHAFLIGSLTRDNAAPVAVDDSASTSVETPKTIDILHNDSDADSDTLAPSLLTQPANGTATLNADGTVTYTPNAHFAGTDSFTYADSDGYAESNVATVTVDVVDHPPVCSAAPSTTTLWPPNHKLVEITLSGATDSDVGDSVTTQVIGVTQDEALTGGGSGSTAFDAKLASDPASVWLRSERAGTGDGRVYTIAYTATDSYGQMCAGTTNVSVPHDQAHAATATANVVVNSLG